MVLVILSYISTSIVGSARIVFMLSMKINNPQGGASYAPSGSDFVLDLNYDQKRYK